MKPQEWRRVREIFDAALELAPDARRAFVEERCAGDAALRARVEGLITAHDEAGQFGERPIGVSVGLLAAGPSRYARDARPGDEDVSEADSSTDGEGHDMSAARRPLFAWVMRAAVVPTVALFAYGAYALATRSPFAADVGWSERAQDGAWVVSSVDPAGEAAGRLEAGDVLWGFEGGPMAGRVGTALYRRALSPGDSYRVTVERDGERIDLALTVGQGPGVRAELVYYFLLSLVWCAVGLFIGLARPDLVTARLAAAASWATGFVFLDWALFRGGPLIHPLHVLLGYHFFSRFPTGRPAARPWRWGLGILYAAGLVSIALALPIQAARLQGGAAGMAELAARWPWLIELRPFLATHVFRASLVLMVLVGIANYRRLVSEDQRRRVRWLVFGAVVGLAPQVIWVAAEVAFGVSAVAWMATPANSFTLVVPLAAAYAVVKHRVFEIKVIIRRGVRYLLAKRVLQAAVALPVAALAFTLVRHRELTLVALVAETRGYLLWTLACGLVLSVRTPLQRGIDKRFFREQYDRERLLLEILDGVRKVDSISELALVVHEQLVAALHPTVAYVWYRDPEELALTSSSSPLLTPPDAPSEGAWLAWLERHGQAAVLPLPAAAGLSRREASWFAEHDIGLLVPIVDGTDRVVGVLMLGEKRSEEPYSAGDTKLLGAVARQAAVVRENLRLRARVDEEVRVKHEVLARLHEGGTDLMKECPACGACFDGDVERCSEDGRALTLSLPVRRTLDGRYRLDRLLGKGGMGAVYRAHDLHLDRPVAVKVLLGSAFGRQEALRRFRREARATARMTHANIVTVHDYGALEGRGAYLVMELLAGITLRAELDRRGALSPAETALWFGPLLEGVTAAHAAGMVHRDLKPENVMGRTNPVREVKVLDLGLVKLASGEGATTGTVTAPGLVMGTLAYMSPEQFAGRAVDARADVFSIGVMLTETLTGRRPPSVLKPGRLRALERWAEHLARSPRASKLDEVVRRCVAGDPVERWPSAEALGEVLMPLLTRGEAPGNRRQ